MQRIGSRLPSVLSRFGCNSPAKKAYTTPSKPVKKNSVSTYANRFGVAIKQPYRDDSSSDEESKAKFQSPVRKQSTTDKYQTPVKAKAGYSESTEANTGSVYTQARKMLYNAQNAEVQRKLDFYGVSDSKYDHAADEEDSAYRLNSRYAHERHASHG
jgi:hypothetical protein